MMRTPVDRLQYLPVTLLSVGIGLAVVGMQLSQPRLWPMWTYVLLCLAGLSFILCALLRRLPTWVLLAGAAALAFGSTGWRASHYASRILSADLQGRDIVVQGQIMGLPQWLPNGVRFSFAVDSATLDGQPVALPDTLSLAWYLPRDDAATTAQAAPAIEPQGKQAEVTSDSDRCTPCVKPGERWRLGVRLKQPHGSRNPYGFDYELWLWEQGLGATGYVRTGAGKTLSEKTGQAHPLDVRVWRDRARLQAREAVYRTLLPQQTDARFQTAHAPFAGAGVAADAEAPSAERAAGIVAALLMGDQRAIAQPDWKVFRITGVSHLLSISGLHITLFAWLAGSMVSALWRQSARLRLPVCLWLPAPLAALWGGMALATAYAWFSGWGVPAQRTCIMLLAVTLLRTGGMAWPWQAILAAAAAAVLLIDPWALLQPGFWLSFLAVGVLFATTPSGHTACCQWHQKLKRALTGFLRTQVAIMLVWAPLSLLLFGQFSLVGLAANAVAVPLITFIVTPLVLLGTAWPAS
ncbi:MAG: ComEC/Rec2 family competence protein [Brachymonas sp.]